MYKTFHQACEQLADIRAIDFFFAKEVFDLVKKTTPSIITLSSELYPPLHGAKGNDLEQKSNEVLFHILIKLMHVYSHGHSCLKIADISNKTIFASEQSTQSDAKVGFKMPSFDEIVSILESLDYDKLPIYFAKEYDSLYIKRLWNYEVEIANFIKSRTIQNIQQANNIEEVVDKLFEPADEIDWQKQAVIKSLNYNFSIISGGPGTGKTTTVAKLLLAIQMSNQNQQRIALLAPTGKAAQRMRESLNSVLSKRVDNDSYLGLSNLEAQTIHRFLGLRPNSTHVKYNEQSKAPYDVIIVDEASMLDMNIFIKLIRAVADNTKLILIGDTNQLPSVEAGSLLANFTHHRDGDITPYTTLLIKNYRSQQYINNLAASVLKGDINTDNHQNENINFHSIRNLDTYLREYAKRYSQLEKCRDYKEALTELNKFRILVANKNLEIGTDKLNQKIEKFMSKPIDSNYKGKPIMITQNSYSLGLFNGDVGIIWPDDTGKLRAYFDGKDAKAFSLNMLPKYESVYAMTIHKTQGSEFDEIVIILPAEDNEALCKQLLYTAITRAKHKLTIISEQSSLRDIAQKDIKRNSNISELVSLNN
ncbi:exodeoxyribonuclease V subunit alpha [Francisella philomiragia]|uniref:RecBCD enzyme subunit RecD n=1 Tax=Francisella philomiragia subsp. philomiragia (strain ATCC 25017 / CCUG 19701 / FSC 153 / O\|nr:exodeoxyribonuclease V subunit alpha [Francisella philomiragia]AJI47171.1 exodeoxyribonuclease V, alpha subunit [Francisella philomiragia]AJI48761.1 exodeoxyribonuclease V, alpha subunit [Francisella philomiragia]MBK2020562.1 exodeoxyribonuclease V subunit alpha [Francisella philomiragia]MBK2030332.1 exodeoxyribonuclease V subunit alpha [Francisella philomiragia]MBK2263810.1 exodeoxyribonuclease V subunit alpha [Francisella philomiragia]